MKVAVALIIDDQQRILITQRPHHVPHGGYWEFPGGKLEANETAEQALVREIKEEVGLDVFKYHRLGNITHSYPDKTVQLIIFQVSEFSGHPSCQEGQLNMKWIGVEQLDHQDFPEANHEIFNLLAKSAST